MAGGNGQHCTISPFFGPEISKRLIEPCAATNEPRRFLRPWLRFGGEELGPGSRRALCIVGLGRRVFTSFGTGAAERIADVK